MKEREFQKELRGKATDPNKSGFVFALHLISWVGFFITKLSEATSLQSKIASDQKDHKLEFNERNCDYYREKKFVKKGDLKNFCEWTQRPYGKGKIILLIFGLGHEKVKCWSAGNFCLGSASAAMLVLCKLCFQFPDSRALTEIKTHLMLSLKTRTYAHNYRKTKTKFR